MSLLAAFPRKITLFFASSITSSAQQRHAGKHLGYKVIVQWTMQHAMPMVLKPQQEGKPQHLGGHVMPHQVQDGGQAKQLHVGHLQHLHLGGHVMPHQVHDGGQHVHVGKEQGHLQFLQHSGGHVMQQSVHDGGQRVQDNPLTWTRQHGLGPMPIAGGHEQVKGASHGLNMYCGPWALAASLFAAAFAFITSAFAFIADDVTMTSTPSSLGSSSNSSPGMMTASPTFRAIADHPSALALTTLIGMGQALPATCCSALDRVHKEPATLRGPDLGEAH